MNWFNLELELDWPEHDRYSLDILKKEQTGSVVAVNNLIPSASDTLMVTLPAPRFTLREYELRVTADHAEIALYRMRVNLAIKSRVH